jgi:hypothetical protein
MDKNKCPKTKSQNTFGIEKSWFLLDVGYGVKIYQ